MECDFIVESSSDTERPALNGWETVVFELEDDPGIIDGPPERLMAK